MFVGPFRGPCGSFLTFSASLFARTNRQLGDLVLVGNEVGLGIVPENRMARAFRDHAGRLHQELAARAGRVELVIAGLPMVVKA